MFVHVRDITSALRCLFFFQKMARRKTCRRDIPHMYKHAQTHVCVSSPQYVLCGCARVCVYMRVGTHRHTLHVCVSSPQYVLCGCARVCVYMRVGTHRHILHVCWVCMFMHMRMIWAADACPYAPYHTLICCPSTLYVVTPKSMPIVARYFAMNLFSQSRLMRQLCTRTHASSGGSVPTRSTHTHIHTHTHKQTHTVAGQVQVGLIGWP